MDIEAVIAQATEPAAPESKATEVAQTAETPTETDVDPSDSPAKPEVKPDSELTPEQLSKREANRQSHLNSKLAKMRRENRELRELTQRMASQPPQANPPTDNGAPKPPREEDFQSWDELRNAERKYYEDLADWKIEQKLADRDKKTQESAQSNELSATKAVRIQEIANQEQEFASKNPEYTALYQEYSDFMENMPPPVAEALLEADNATLALFALMKEGRLEHLEDMSPYRISMEIGKAEIRGKSYLEQNKATNAPTPIEAARGTGNPSKSLNNKSVEELMKQFG